MGSNGEPTFTVTTFFLCAYANRFYSIQKPEDGYAVNYVNKTFQCMKGKYMIQFDG